MTQEVQVVLTLEVDAEMSKEDIKRFFYDMEENHMRSITPNNRWEFPKISIVEVKEESEIYNLK